MLNKYQNNWKLIVTSIIYICWSADADNEITSVTSGHREDLNKSHLFEDSIKRVKFKASSTTEFHVRDHTFGKNYTRNKQHLSEKYKHRHYIDKDRSIMKPYAHKYHEHIRQRSNNITEHRTIPTPTPYQNSFNEHVEPKKRFKTEAKHRWLATKPKQSDPPVVENKGNILNQTNISKPAIRTGGRYRDYSNEDVSERKFRKTTVRITKMHMAYQLQDDKEEEMIKFGKERLNPYAIHQQMMTFMQLYKDNMNITMERIGRTAEYNNIMLLKITQIKKEQDRYFRSKYADEPPEKKIIFIVHGLAVSGMGLLMNSEEMFRTLMSYYTAYLRYFDIFVIPIANPDGFTAVLNLKEYTLKISAMWEQVMNYSPDDNFAIDWHILTTVKTYRGKFWNKNMSPQSSCAGVMLDRNFDVEWNMTHRISPCSHVYPGPAPFSEPETRAVRDVLHLYSQKIVAYIHVHASTYHSSIFKGDAVLFPRGYTSVQGDDDKYMDIKGEIEEAMKNATFRVLSVSVESLYSWYGKVLGTSVDYAATVYGIPYAMEFCMQPYEYIENNALLYIWRRVIDVVFNNIRKSIENGAKDR